MAVLSKTAFLTKWASLFADNTTGEISEQDIRDFRQDISDSFLSISDNFVDEDDMVSNSATKAPSQQSVKAYVDAAALGIVTSWKAPVVNATTANITLSGEQTIDGVLTSASRILVKNQSTQSENGIYVTAAGAWARSSDANAAAELEGAAVMVQQGTANANTTWIQTTDGITLGSSNIVWTQLGSSVPDADETTKGIVERATDAEVITGSDTTRFVSPASLHAKVIGVQDLFIPAAAMWPTITNGCSILTQIELATSLFNVQTLDFDQTTEEHAQFQIVLPRKWNNLTITFVPYWTASAGTPGQTVRWQMNGCSYANDDSLTTAPGSSIAVDDTLLATNDLHIGAESSPMTIANTPASMDLLMLQVHRGVASDDLAADAKLLGVSLRITVTAAKDA